MLLGILFAVIIALILWLIASYNRLASLRNQVLNGWRQIDVQLKPPARSDSEPKFASHPPMAARVAALKGVAFQGEARG